MEKHTQVKQQKITQILQRAVNKDPLNQIVCRIQKGKGDNVYSHAVTTDPEQNPEALVLVKL